MHYHRDREEYGEGDFPHPDCQDGRDCFGNCDACDNPPEADDDPEETSYLYGDVHPGDVHGRKWRSRCVDDCHDCPESGPMPACFS